MISVADVALHTLLALATLAIAGCERGTDRLPEYEMSGQVMGTTYSVKLVAPDVNADIEALGDAVDRRLRAIDDRMSTYKPASELSRFNDAASTDWVPVSDELCDLVDRAIAIGEKTDGAFDITVGPLVDLWGFGAAGDNAAIPEAEEIAEARDRVGYTQLRADCSRPALRKTRGDLSIDLSAFAKGYAVDQAAEILITAKQADFLVEVGGELRMQGMNANRKPWAIAVEKPDPDSRSVESILHLTNTALATSGDYRNFFEIDGRRYSHTIDPRTGRPVEHEGAAVTVVTDSAADADALATALLVLGPDKGLELAASEDIAAYFLLRTDKGLEQRATGKFARLVKK